MDSMDFQLRLKPVMDVSDISGSVQQLQQYLNKLNLPPKLKGEFKSTFIEVENKVTSIQQKLDSGFKTKGDVTGLEKEFKSLDVLFKQLSSKLQGLDASKFKGITFNTPEIKDAKQQIAALQEQLNKQLPTGMMDKVSQSIKALGINLKTEAGMVKSFYSALQSGNVQEAADQLATLKNRVKETSESSAELKNMTTLLDQLKNSGVIKTTEDLRAMEQVLLNLKTEELNKLQQRLLQGADGAEQLRQGIRGVGEQSRVSANDMYSMANQMDQLKNRVQYFFSLTNSVMLFRRALRSAFNSVKELDTAMKETAVVTDFSIDDMWETLPQRTEDAKKLGVAIKDVYEARTLYYQQGLKTAEVNQLTSKTLQLARIAGLEAADATDRMTSALRGFNMELNETSAERVADVYANLAAKTASDTDEISSAMSKTASIAANAGMEFETTSAFLAQMIETTREAPENLGTAMKTIIARFTEMKKSPSDVFTDLEGEEVSVNKVDSALQSVGVSLKDASGQFRDLDDVFLELAEKWSSLDKNTQRYIATTAAGSRQQSRFIAMMSNYERTMELVGYANNSAGAAQKQYEKTLDSLETKLQNLKNAWQQFITTIANSELIKIGVDVLTLFLEGVNKIIDILPDGTEAIGAFLLAFVAFKGLGTIFNAGMTSIFALANPLMSTSGYQHGVMYGLAFNKGAKSTGMPIGVTPGIKTKGKTQTHPGFFKSTFSSAAAGAQSGTGFKGKAAGFGKGFKSGAGSWWGNTKTRYNNWMYGGTPGKIDANGRLHSTTGQFMKMGKNGKPALTDKAASFSKIGGIVATIAGTAWGTSIVKKGFDDAIDTSEEKISRYNEVLSELNGLIQENQSLFDNYDSAKDSYEEMTKKLDSLTSGTADWTKALMEVNDQNKQILAKYPELIKYTKELNGATVLTEEGWGQYNNLLQEDLVTQRTAAAGLEVATMAEEHRNRAGSIVDTKDITNKEYKNIDTAATIGGVAGGALGGWALGAALGSVIPVFGTIIGGLVGGLAGALIGGGAAGGVAENIASNGITSEQASEAARIAQSQGFFAETATNTQIDNFIKSLEDAGIATDGFKEAIENNAVEFDEFVANTAEYDIAAEAQRDATISEIASTMSELQGEENEELSSLVTTWADVAHDDYDKKVQEYYNNLDLSTEELKVQYGKIMDLTRDEINAKLEDKSLSEETMKTAIAANKATEDLTDSMNKLAKIINGFNPDQFNKFEQLVDPNKMSKDFLQGMKTTLGVNKDNTLSDMKKKLTDADPDNDAEITNLIDSYVKTTFGASLEDLDMSALDVINNLITAENNFSKMFSNTVDGTQDKSEKVTNKFEDSGVSVSYEAEKAITSMINRAISLNGEKAGDNVTDILLNDILAEANVSDYDKIMDIFATIDPSDTSSIYNAISSIKEYVPDIDVTSVSEALGKNTDAVEKNTEAQLSSEFTDKERARKTVLEHGKEGYYTEEEKTTIAAGQSEEDQKGWREVGGPNSTGMWVWEDPTDQDRTVGGSVGGSDTEKNDDDAEDNEDVVDIYEESKTASDATGGKGYYSSTPTDVNAGKYASGKGGAWNYTTEYYPENFVKVGDTKKDGTATAGDYIDSGYIVDPEYVEEWNKRHPNKQVMWDNTKKKFVYKNGKNKKGESLEGKTAKAFTTQFENDTAEGGTYGKVFGISKNDNTDIDEAAEQRALAWYNYVQARISQGTYTLESGDKAAWGDLSSDPTKWTVKDYRLIKDVYDKSRGGDYKEKYGYENVNTVGQKYVDDSEGWERTDPNKLGHRIQTNMDSVAKNSDGTVNWKATDTTTKMAYAQTQGLIAQAKAWGVSSEKIKEYEEVLENGTPEQIKNATATMQQEVATAKLSKRWQNARGPLKNLLSELKKWKKGSNDYNKVLDQMADNLNTIFGTHLTGSFFTENNGENLKYLKKYLETGSETAYLNLVKNIAKAQAQTDTFAEEFGLNATQITQLVQNLDKLEFTVDGRINLNNLLAGIATTFKSMDSLTKFLKDLGFTDIHFSFTADDGTTTKAIEDMTQEEFEEWKKNPGGYTFTADKIYIPSAGIDDTSGGSSKQKNSKKTWHYNRDVRSEKRQNKIADFEHEIAMEQSKQIPNLKKIINLNKDRYNLLKKEANQQKANYKASLKEENRLWKKAKKKGYDKLLNKDGTVNLKAYNSKKWSEKAKEDFDEWESDWDDTREYTRSSKEAWQEYELQVAELKNARSEYTKLTNLAEKYENISDKITKRQSEYNRELNKTNTSGKSLVSNLVAQENHLKNQLKLQKSIQAAAKQAAKDYRKQSGVGKYVTANLNTGEYTINYGKINAEAKRGIDIEPIEEAIDAYVEYLDQIAEASMEQNSILDEIDNTIQERLQSVVDLQSRVREAIIQSRQEEIDALSTIDSSINDTNSKILTAVQDNISKLRQDRKNEQTEEDLADKQARLAYLRQYTGTGNAAEIAKLEDEIEKGEESYTDTLIDQKISELQKQNDKASEQRQRQIKIMEKQLQVDQENGKITAEARDLMTDGILNGVIDASSDLYKLLALAGGWASMSSEEFQQALNEIEGMAAQFSAYNIGNNLVGTKGSDYRKGSTITFQNKNGKTIRGGKVVGKGAIDVTDNKGVTSHYTGVGQDANGTVVAPNKRTISGQVNIGTGVPIYSSSDGNKVVADTDKGMSTYRGGAYDVIDQTKDMYKIQYYDDKGNAQTGWVLKENVNKDRKLISKNDMVKLNSAGQKIAKKNGFIGINGNKGYYYVVKNNNGVLTLKQTKDGKKTFTIDEKNATLLNRSEGKKATQNLQYLKDDRMLYKFAEGIKLSRKGRNDKEFKDATAKQVKAILGKKMSFVGKDKKGFLQFRRSGMGPKDTTIWQTKSKAPTKIKQFKTGGLADFTGPAWLDGTKTKPEIILNQKDTENFIQLRNILSDVMKGVPSKSNQNNGDSYAEIHINVEKMTSDYDVDQVAKRVKKILNEDGRYRTVNQINRLR